MSTAFERTAEIAIAAKCLLEAARPVAQVLPGTQVRRENLLALQLAVECMDQVLAPPLAPDPPYGCGRTSCCPQCDPLACPDYDPEAVPR